VFRKAENTSAREFSRLSNVRTLCACRGHPYIGLSDIHAIL